MGLVFSASEFAKLIGKSEKMVRNMMQDGMPAIRGGRGRPTEINSEDAIRWMITSEINKRFGDEENPDSEENTSEDIALKRVRREKIELELRYKRGELIPIDGLETVLNELATTYSSQLDGLASRMAGELAGIDDPAQIRQLIFAETRRIRAATAERILAGVYRLAEAANPLFASSGIEDNRSASGEDGE